ncbi:phospholipase effector Tle1 domain-containing protein [Shewanella algae]|uniref:phospholipase effector Tle1 domain-containing protein n=1 Tax=Shewanella algae TaxID=38313 RepID=UPI0030044CD9
MSQHTIPCETLTDWIEIDFRDESNQPLSGLTATVTDAAGNSRQLKLTGGPQLITCLAPGAVTLTFDTDSWLKAVMSRRPLNAAETSAVPEYVKAAKGFNNTAKQHLQATVGDFWQQPPTAAVAERHQAGKGKSGAIELLSRNAYVVEIQAFKWLTVRMGLFFDGTANNTYNVDWGRQQQERAAHYCMNRFSVESQEQALELAAQCQAPMPKAMENLSATNEYTNVQKLEWLYANQLYGAGLLQFGLYVKGIGSSLEEPANGIDDDDAFAGVAAGRGDNGVESRVEQALNDVCQNKLKSQWGRLANQYDGVGKFEFDLFGFSRGAAAARHCANMVLREKDNLFQAALAKHCSDVPLRSDMDWQNNEHCQIHFVGIYDTVAAIATLWDGIDPHDEHNGDVKLWLDPKRVKKVVHLTANPRDEFRYNFSLNSLNNASRNPTAPFFEAVLPGAHSDLGGGYYSRQFFDGKVQSYNPLFTETKLVAAYHSRLPKNAVSSNSPVAFGQGDDPALTAKVMASNAGKKVLREIDRLVTMNWCQTSDLSIDYVVRPVLQGNKNREPEERVTVKLTMTRIVEGDLSRLYLRLMAGLAKFSGVNFDEGAFEQKWSSDSSYKVEDLNGHFNLLGRSFAAICEEVLQQATQGQLHPLLGDESFRRALRPHFIHHSADVVSVAGGFIVPYIPNDGNARAVHPAVKGK